MRYSWKISGAALLAGAVCLVPNVNLVAQSDQQTLDPRAAHSGPILTNFISGIDRGTRVAVSTHGNIVAFTSPNVAGAQYEHLGVGAFSEGYVVCYTPNVLGGTNVTAVDTGDFDNGRFGAAVTTVGPTTVTRTTTDGYVRLKQSFVFNGTNKSLQIKMDLTNISNITEATDASLVGVTLRRQADFDVDTGGTSGWAAFANRFFADTRDGVTAWNDRVDAPAGAEAHALTLRHITGTFPVAGRSAKVTGNILDSSCNPAHTNTAALSPPYSRNDFGGTLQYSLPTALAPGRTVSATVMYVRH